MEITDKILDQIVNPFIIADGRGEILRISEPIAALMRASGVKNIGFMKNIDPLFRPNMPIISSDMRVITIGNVSRKAFVYFLNRNGKDKRYLYIFKPPEILRKMDFETLLDYIDDAIAIVNYDGLVDNFNEGFTRLSGIDRRIWEGKNLNEMEERGIIKESVTLKVLKKIKKAAVMNVQYETGRTVTWTSLPVYNANGGIEKVISTGRDITTLIELEENLRHTETLAETYYNKLNALEALVGGNKIIIRVIQ